MKLIKYFFLIAFLLLAPHVALAQTGCDACKLILQNGLYRTLSIKRSGTFEQDLKTYFASETFKNDFKNHSWGGDLNVVVPIDGVPTPIGLKANASDGEINNFQQRIATATSIKISQSFYDSLLSSIPDVELAREYTSCVIATCSRFGLRPFVDIGENEVTFSINYTKEFSNDAMPTVKNFAVVNGQVLSGALQIGSMLGDVNTIVVKRIQDKDLIFLLDTDKGGVSRRIPGEPAGFNADLPVGTVISSMLTWTEFQAITKNNSRNRDGDFWTSRFSKWAPADGRGIGGSGYEKVTGLAQVPEMRGRFLRGLNIFDAERPAIGGSQGDPDTRERGSFQADDLKAHQHNYREWRHNVHIGDGGFEDGLTSNQDNHPNVDTTGGPGGAETRPRNVAVFYYIRIN